MTSRRGFLLGLGAALAAPSIVRAESLMKLWVPVAPRVILPDAGSLVDPEGRTVGWWKERDGRVDFRWDDPSPTGYYSTGTNHSLTTFVKVGDVLKFKRFSPTHGVFA